MGANGGPALALSITVRLILGGEFFDRVLEDTHTCSDLGAGPEETAVGDDSDGRADDEREHSEREVAASENAADRGEQEERMQVRAGREWAAGSEDRGMRRPSEQKCPPKDSNLQPAD